MTTIVDTPVTRVVVVPAVETLSAPPPVAESRAVAIGRFQTLKRRAMARSATGRSIEAVQLMDSALSRVAAREGAMSVDAAIARGQRAVLLLHGGEIEEATREILAADSLLRRTVPPNDTVLAKADLWMGVLELWQSRPDSALTRFQSAYDIRSRIGRSHPMRAMAACGMGLSLRLIGETDASAHWRRPYCHMQRRMGQAYDMFVEIATAGARRAESTR
jgi:hypothetical protein